MGESVFSTITHDDWRSKREWYNPGFREGHVLTMFQSMNGCVDAFMDKLKPLADGTTTVQMKLQLEEFLTEVISKVCFFGGGGGFVLFFVLFFFDEDHGY